MDLKGILAIGGQPGLFKNISQGKNHIIVESLTTGKRMPAYTTAKISSLDDIAIYTYEEDVPLKDVFSKIYEKENGGKAIDHKASSADMFSYIETVLPQIDKDRVYHSDLKKLFQWYNLLIELDFLKPTENLTETETETDSETETETDLKTENE